MLSHRRFGVHPSVLIGLLCLCLQLVCLKNKETCFTLRLLSAHAFQQRWHRPSWEECSMCYFLRFCQKGALGEMNFLDKILVNSEQQKVEWGPDLVCMATTPHSDNHLMSGALREQWQMWWLPSGARGEEPGHALETEWAGFQHRERFWWHFSAYRLSQSWQMNRMAGVSSQWDREGTRRVQVDLGLILSLLHCTKTAPRMSTAFSLISTPCTVPSLPHPFLLTASWLA